MDNTAVLINMYQVMVDMLKEMKRFNDNYEDCMSRLSATNATNFTPQAHEPVDIKDPYGRREL